MTTTPQETRAVATQLGLEGKRLLILEEGLRDYHAHFFTWIKAIRKINQNAGVEVLVGGHRAMDAEIQEALQAHAIYSHNSWEGIYNSSNPIVRYYGILMHNGRVYRQTKKLLQELGHVDCIELTAGRLHVLLAWWWLCKRFMGKRFDRLVITMLTSQAFYDANQKMTFKRSAVMIRKAMQLFRPWIDTGQVCFAADSHLIAKEYKALTGIDFRLFPSPGVALQEWQSRQPPQIDSDRGPCFTTLGVSYYDKGIDVFQEAILKFLERHPETKARFVLHWAKQTDGPDGPIPIKDALRNAPQVTVLEHVLSREEYQEHLLAADCIVLPYRRAVYYARSSGVTVEAACAGIPMIVTHDTWLSWTQNKIGAGLTFKDEDASDLCRALQEFASRWSELSEEAMRQRQVALDYNSADNYLRCLWQTEPL